MTTYTGPKRITPAGADHVREVVETGDFEGVLKWVIGLDAQRPFTRAPAAGTPTRQLVDHVRLSRSAQRQSRMTLPNVASDATSS